MIALFKSLPLAAFLTLVVTLFVGSGGSTGDALAVFGFTVEGMRLYWLWVLFCATVALVWALMLLMGD